MSRETKDRITVSRSRTLALTAVFAALYAVLVVAFAPISVGPVQLRLADVLLPLVILFGWPAIFGLGIGTVVGNFAADTIGGFPSGSIGIDIVGGSLVNVLVGVLAWRIGQREWRVRNWNASWFSATVVQTALISIVVGGYLSYVFSTPIIGQILLILAGEIIAVNIGGFVLLGVIGRPKSLDLFRSWGFQIYGKNSDR